MKIRIEPYKTWSGGAKALGLRCGILRATKRQVTKHGDFDVIINWGRNAKRFAGNYINVPSNVCCATDKVRTLTALQAAQVSHTPFCLDKETAQTWLDSGDTVVARTMLRASGGRGIVLCSKTGDNQTKIQLPSAPLYTRYVKKGEEYRVHVAFGEVIDVQLKKRRLEVPDDKINWQIRNACNGWIFARSDVSCPDVVSSNACAAVSALGLDFGAVDVGYNLAKGTCVVFEVNTAPGLEGTTLDNYYNAFLKKFPCLKGGMYKKRREGTV